MAEYIYVGDGQIVDATNVYTGEPRSERASDFVGLPGELIESIDIGEDGDSGPGDYMAYRITIKTSLRVVTIRGCHDMGPEMEVTAPAPHSPDSTPTA